MKLFEALLMALSIIWTNKMRSLLTMLGLIIGISSVVTIVSLGESTQAYLENSFEVLGFNSIILIHNNREKLSPQERLNSKDIDAIEKAFAENIDAISPRAGRSATLVENLESTYIRLEGLSMGSSEIENLSIIKGRFLNEFDMDDRALRIIIDSQLAKDIFNSTDIIGERIRINTGKTTSSYMVIGVYEEKESLMGFTDTIGYIPYSTLDKIFNLNGRVSGININFKSNVDDETMASQILSYVERRHSNETEEKYTIFSAETQKEIIGDALGQITLFISAIAGISLVVGGIGIMNIMLVSVTERTREIGIRKAVGARRIDILSQFLIEAITISVFGGLLGALFGNIFTRIASTLLDLPEGISLRALTIAVVFSISIGLFFGIYPANKAAKLNPIDALRYE